MLLSVTYVLLKFYLEEAGGEVKKKVYFVYERILFMPETQAEIDGFIKQIYFMMCSIIDAMSLL